MQTDSKKHKKPTDANNVLAAGQKMSQLSLNTILKMCEKLNINLEIKL